MGLHGHTALVTGAAQGIGRACAEELAARGANLVIVDRNPEGLAEVSDLLVEKGTSVVSLPLDLTDRDKVRVEIGKLAEEVLVDILVNNAGFDRPGTVAKIDTEDMEAVLGIHITSAFLLIKLLLPGMKSAGWGRIISMSSIYGQIGAKGETAYCTAKAAIIGMTKSVAKEVGKYGITVNAILPGLTLTPAIKQFMADKYQQEIIDDTPLGRAAQPREIATVAAFLASSDASYITGAGIPVSGGWGI
ncbi:MAG: SDR family NAD(P)-dependent oxidoreductase [Pseudomonadota bacterium]